MTIDPGEMSLEDYLKSDNFTVTKDLKLMDGTSDDFCHVSQTGFFYTLKGTEQTTVLFCGDRWSDFASNILATKILISCDKTIPRARPTPKEIAPIIRVSKKRIRDIFLLDIPKVK